MSWVVGGLIWLGTLLCGGALRELEHERALRRLGSAAPGDLKFRPTRRPSALLRDWRFGVVLGTILGLALGGTTGAAIGGLIGFSIGVIRARRRAGASAALCDDQLADSVRSISAGLRAGLSVHQSIAYAADEAEPPSREALCDLADSLAVGVPLDEALVSWADSLGSADARLLCGVLRMNRRSGGELPAVLDEVATTLRDRREAAREVHALTAQARLSGAILGFLPIGFFAFLWITSRRDIQGALNSPTGLGAVGIGSALDAVAFLWIRRLLDVR